MQLIDLDKTYKRLEKDIWWTDSTKASIRHFLNKEKRVDAVPVVRCKDCVNYCGFDHCKNGICDLDSVSKRAVYPNDFCSYGERKDNEG